MRSGKMCDVTEIPYTVGIALWPFKYTGYMHTRVSDGFDLIGLAVKHRLGVELLEQNAGVIKHARSRGVAVTAHLPELWDEEPAYRHGLCDPDLKIRRKVISSYHRAIDLAAPGEKVLIFTGVVSKERRDGKERQRILYELTELVKYAERKDVILVLEHLNDKGSHEDDMLGHTDYVGSDLTWVAGIVKEFNSAYLKLLFDVYHVEIMHPGKWNILLRKYIDIIGHIHIAGVIDDQPSRVSFRKDNTVCIKRVSRALRSLDYSGSIGLEFVLSDEERPDDVLSLVGEYLFNQ